jgi:hypothetical protein
VREIRSKLCNKVWPRKERQLPSSFSTSRYGGVTAGSVLSFMVDSMRADLCLTETVDVGSVRAVTESG